MFCAAVILGAKVYCNSAVGAFGTVLFLNLAFINITKLFAITTLMVIYHSHSLQSH